MILCSYIYKSRMYISHNFEVMGKRGTIMFLFWLLLLFSRLQWKAKEQHKAIESELSDREKFLGEVTETIEWLDGVRANILVEPAVGDVDGQVEKQHALKEEVELKRAATQKLIDQHRERYADESEMPADLLEQVLTL